MAVDYGELAKYFSGRANPGPGAVDVAKYILLNADVKRQPIQQQSTNSPSLMGRIFDILSRPNYAVANFAKGIVHGNPSLRDVVSGLSGTQKTTFSKVLEEAGMPKSVGRSALGFALDVGLDPTSYVPVAGVVSKIKNIGKGAEEIAPALNKTQELLKHGEPINPELFGLPVGKKPSTLPDVLKKPVEPVPIEFPKDVTAQLPASPGTKGQLQIGLPGVTPRFTLPKIVEKKVSEEVIPRAKGQLGLNLKLKAADIVDEVSKGNPQAIARVAPRPGISFEPRHQALADQILKNFDPKKATAELNKKFPDTLNAKQQVRLYYKAIDAAKTIVKNPDWVTAHANKIYAAVEKTLQERGFVPRLGTGENVRLSDVIQQMGGPRQAKVVLEHFSKDLTPQSPIWDAVEGLRAANAIDESKSVKFITDSIAESKAAVQASNTLSDAGAKEYNDFLKHLGKKVATTVEISPSSKDATRKLIDHIINSGKSAAQVAIEQKSKMIDEIIAKGQGARAELN